MGNKEDKRANELSISNISFLVGRWSWLKAYTFRCLAECSALRSSPHPIVAYPGVRHAFGARGTVEPNPTGFANLSWFVSLSRYWAHVRRLEGGQVTRLRELKRVLLSDFTRTARRARGAIPRSSPVFSCRERLSQPII